MIFSLLGGVGGLTLREYVLVNGFSTGAIGAVAGGIFGFWAIDGITKHRATNGLVTLVAQVLNKMVCLIDPPPRFLSVLCFMSCFCPVFVLFSLRSVL
jgi:hypothetical protein